MFFVAHLDFSHSGSLSHSLTNFYSSIICVCMSWWWWSKFLNFLSLHCYRYFCFHNHHHHHHGAFYFLTTFIHFFFYISIFPSQRWWCSKFFFSFHFFANQIVIFFHKKKQQKKELIFEWLKKEWFHHLWILNRKIQKKTEIWKFCSLKFFFTDRLGLFIIFLVAYYWLQFVNILLIKIKKIDPWSIWCL